ncbi:phosphotransferase family protein [Sphaerisporangium viridialbum]|uniref:phosphotransferase family protein n=1 Tax=Sphaerisporangium viridialbum TaxID=46189 RepID=UPI003C739A4C
MGDNLTGDEDAPQTTLWRTWQALPQKLREQVAHRLSAPVVGFTPRPGGFSGGVLGVLLLSDGDQVFVKAAPADDLHAEDYRTEAHIGSRLPPEIPSPRLRFVVEQAGWILLCFDVAPGQMPHEPWHPGELAMVLRALTASAHALTPTPITGLPTVTDRMAGRCQTWRALERGEALDTLTIDDLDDWERQHLDRLARIEADWADMVKGDTLLHFDLRFDNCMIGEDGTALLVDWGRACTGPAWVDLVCLLLQSNLGDLDPQGLFLGHPLGRTAETQAVDAFLTALASYWTHTATLPGPAHAPHLRRRREESRKTTIRWLQHRWSR